MYAPYPPQKPFPNLPCHPLLHRVSTFTKQYPVHLKMATEKENTVNGDAQPTSWLLEQPILTRRKLRIVCVGAGYSGLTLAHQIQHEHKLEDEIDFAIYEKNPEVGGTW